MPKKGYIQSEEHRQKSIANGLKFKEIGHTDKEKQKMSERAKKWSKEDEDFLAANWVNNTPWDELLSRLNRSKNAIRNKVNSMHLGTKRRKLWGGSKIYKSTIDGMCYAVHNSSGYLTTHINKKHLKIHRIEMEKILGRELLPHERVHHKNGNKKDNHQENLMIYDHNKRHAHIDTDRAECAERFIKQKGLWKEFIGGAL